MAKIKHLDLCRRLLANPRLTDAGDVEWDAVTLAGAHRCRCSGAPMITLAIWRCLTGMSTLFIDDEAMNGTLFQTYVGQVLIPSLSKGDIVEMDNLSAHKTAGVREAIEAAGTNLLFLPPYGPDFNPIENAFAKLKTPLRAKAERTVAALWDTVGAILDVFTPAKCANYFKAAGYDPD